MTNCTRCEQTGFLNIDQIPDEILKEFDDKREPELIEKWINDNPNSDVCPCDCCDGSGFHSDSEKIFNCM